MDFTYIIKQYICCQFKITLKVHKKKHVPFKERIRSRGVITQLTTVAQYHQAWEDAAFQIEKQDGHWK